jgi:hypothetical protein
LADPEIPSASSQRGAALLLNSGVLVALSVPRIVFLTTMAIEKPTQWMNLYLHLAWLAVVIVGLLAGALMAGSQERRKNPAPPEHH